MSRTCHLGRKKPFTKERYPYTLTGRIYCGTCGERLAGKSAHGAQAKSPYYEHNRIVKIQAMLSKQIYACQPHRFPGAVAEEKVWREVERILSGEMLAEAFLKEAKKALINGETRQEEGRVKTKIYQITAQIDALTSRLSELPKDISICKPFELSRPLLVFLVNAQLQSIPERL